MEASDFLNKHKNKILNAGTILLSLFVAANIYKQQMKVTDSLKVKMEAESKKNIFFEGIGSMEKKIAAYKNLLVPKETGVVINTISRMARDSNVNIVSIKPAVPQKFPNYVKIPFTLVLSAPSFYDLGNFVSRLESFQDVYTIESMNTKRQGLASELQADLTINSISYQ